jgi:hypothetical protein
MNDVIEQCVTVGRRRGIVETTLVVAVTTNKLRLSLEIHAMQVVYNKTSS